MKSLLKNYIEKLSLNDLINFGEKNDINLSVDDYKFILNLLKDNFDDILRNDNKYLSILESKIDSIEYLKIKNLFLKYKEKYSGYLF